MNLLEILRDGDIILFHTKGLSPMSWAIRYLTESYWNHCGMYVGGHVIEALGSGVVKNPVSNYIDNKKYALKVVAFRQEAFKDEAEYLAGIKTAIARMEALIGKKYDWWAIAWLGFKYLCKGSYKKTRQYIPVGNPLQSRDKFFCSESICEACHKISSLFPQFFAGKTVGTCDTKTPKDIGKAQTVKLKWGLNVA